MRGDYARFKLVVKSMRMQGVTHLSNERLLIRHYAVNVYSLETWPVSELSMPDSASIALFVMLLATCLQGQ
jgi:hypothetical protein